MPRKIAASGVYVQRIEHSLGGSVTPGSSAAKSGTSAVAGSVTAAGSIGRLANYLETATITMVSVLVSLVARAIGGSSTASGTAAGQGQRSLTGSTTIVGSTLRSAVITREGQVTATGVMLRSAFLAFAGSITPDGLAARLAITLLGGSVTGSATATPLLVTLFNVSSSLTPSGTLTTTRGTFVGGTLTATSSLLRQSYRTLAATITLAGSAAAIATYHFVYSLASSITPAGTLRSDAAIVKAGAVTATANTIKLTIRNLASKLTASAIAVPLGSRNTGGSITATSTFGIISVFLKDIAASITMSAERKRETIISRLASIMPTPVTALLGLRSVSGSVTPSGDYDRVGLLTRLASITLSATMLRALTRWSTSVMLPTGKAERMARRLEGGTMIVTGLASRFGAYVLSITARIEMAGQIERDGQKRLTANIPVSGFPGAVTETQVAGSVTGTSTFEAKKFTPYTLLASITPSSIMRRESFKYVAREITLEGRAIRLASRWVSGAITVLGNIVGLFRAGKVEVTSDVFVVTRLEARVFTV